MSIRLVSESSRVFAVGGSLVMLADLGNRV